MTSKNVRAHFLYYIKLCASYQILRWYQTEVTVRKRTIRFKIGDFVVPCDLEIWWMTLENNSVPLLYFIKFVHHLKTMVEFKLELQSRNAQLGSKSAIFVPCDLEIWWMTLENNRTPVLYHIKLCASFQNHGWIQTGVTVRKRSIRVKIGIFVPFNLEIWRMTLKNNKAPLQCCFKLCASFHSYQWIQTRVTVRKRHVTLKFDG